MRWLASAPFAFTRAPCSVLNRCRFFRAAWCFRLGLRPLAAGMKRVSNLRVPCAARRNKRVARSP